MYKKDLLGFSSHRRKREAKLKKQKAKGQEESPFDMFVAATDIRYCYYKESDRILGYSLTLPFLIKEIPSGCLFCRILKHYGPIYLPEQLRPSKEEVWSAYFLKQ
jgi:hypothetical protein